MSHNNILKNMERFSAKMARATTFYSEYDDIVAEIKKACVQQRVSIIVDKNISPTVFNMLKDDDYDVWKHPLAQPNSDPRYTIKW